MQVPEQAWIDAEATLEGLGEARHRVETHARPARRQRHAARQQHARRIESRQFHARNRRWKLRSLRPARSARAGTSSVASRLAWIHSIKPAKGLSALACACSKGLNCDW